MTERGEDVGVQVAAIDRKVDALAVTMNQRFEEMNQMVNVRFAEVSEAFAEQRRYTDFAYDRLDGRISQLDARLITLETKVDSGFARMERKLDQLLDRT